MQIPIGELNEATAYRLQTGLIVPRPIAWVMTRSKTGIVNLAPFSAFMFVASWPPLPAISCNLRDGTMKDTERNIRDRGEFVINIADETMVEEVHESSADYPPETSEAAALGLALADSVDISVPRLADVPASMECRLHTIIPFGAIGHHLIVGEVVRYHVRDELYDNGKVETARLRPIGRLGGVNYARLGEILTLPSVGKR